MNVEHPQYRAARDIAVVLLRPILQPTPEDVRSKAELGLMAIGNPPEVDLENLTADLLHSFNIFAGSSSALDDTHGHIDWLPSKRGGISWHFWHRYETWLEQQIGLPLPVVRNLGDLTDEILKRLEDPARLGEWVRHGMVVGSVQSGKTSNYTGLICKAVDAGYRIIIVLTGLHNNLRSQTQLRLDEGFLGFDTEKDRLLNQNNKFKGVGLLPSAATLHVLSLTSCADDGDFKKAVANGITGTLGGVPTVLVVKKNGRILKNLREWLVHLARSEVIRDVPLLLIDDEADQASINTKARSDLAQGQLEAEDDVSTINRRIREILAAFEKRVYVGYTATPFANIFINPDAQHERFEDDIFPRSFILNVRPPGTYVGPARVFGLEGDPDAGIESRDPLPLVNIVDDYADFFPPGHKRDHVPLGLPQSLKHAIRWFILTCAARYARGQITAHNSMLIHVTRFVDVQNAATDLVKAELDALRKRITYGDGARKERVRDELALIWESEFSTKEVELRKLASDEVGTPLSWSQVDLALHEAISKMEVKQINGTAKDVLDYVNHPDGFSVIAVGGDKLSRGLTLEGLSVSYFLRTSRMYDTLMQMGRWFGYRRGYLDLCRLYTTLDLRGWYRHIALAEEELRREFEYMALSGLTPENYGLRVRSHSGGLVVTAINKMCHAHTLELSFAGELKQTAHFAVDVEIRKRNVEVLEAFMATVGRADTHEPRGLVLGWLWRVSSRQLCEDLLRNFAIHPQCHTLDVKRVIDFIYRQNEQDELTTWTVALVNNSQSTDLHRLGGYSVGITERAGEIANGIFSTLKANIQSPAHQAFDLTTLILNEGLLADLLAKRDRAGEALFSEDEEQCLRDSMGITLDKVAIAVSKLRAGKEGRTAAESPHGRVIRELRPITHGLILIYALRPADVALVPDEPPYLGLALSFPTSHTARSISYEANKVLIRELKDDGYED